VEPHRIRLRGPWDCQPLSRIGGGTLPGPLRMALPCRWDEGGLADFAGHVRFTRRFGLPTNLDATEQVWLVFQGVDETASVTLNGTLLGTHENADEPFAFAVTPLLKARNDLQVDVECSNTRGGLWGEVALEIREL
jgi:beta-galactosidase/beta-glucuronidase